MSTVFKYILDFKANTENFQKDVGGVQGMLKGAAVAAGALFAADKVMEAAAAVADYAKEISNTKMAVETLAGVQGAAANKMAGEVTAIAKSYDQDVNESIKAANVVMKSFGETSTEAFKLFNLGFAGAANANGDLLQQVSEYSPHFAEAGLSAQQMFAVIAEGNKAGVFDDKTADMIKEGSIRLREMTKSTSDALNGIGLSSTTIQKAIADGSMTMFEVMQKVSAKLKELPAQAPQVGAALADIFGGPGEDGVNFVRMLADVDTSLSGLIDSANSAQVRYTETLAEFHKVGATVFGGTGELMTKMKTIGMEMVNGLIKGVVSVINYFIDLYNESAVVRGAFEYIGLVVKTVWGEISLVFKTILNNFKAFGAVWKAIFTGDFKAIPGIIENLFDSAKNNVADFGQKTAENFKTAVENTLNPREKVKLITFDDAATEAGAVAGKKFAKATAEQMANMSNLMPSAPFKADERQKGTLDYLVSFNPNKNDKKLDPNKLVDMSESMQRNTERAQEMQEQMNAQFALVQERAEAVSGAVSSAFDSMSNNLVDSFGLADNGFQGFIKGMASTALKLIGMMLSQSIANAIAGATASGTATGPAAIFTTPAFIATAVGGIFSAFAAIPKFAAGGIAYGPTMGMIGEYPGASSNPEVIAPLSKLRDMIGDRSNAIQQVQVEVIGSISGDTIRLSQTRAERRNRAFSS